MPEILRYLPEKCPLSFYMIIVRKIFSPNFGGHVPPPLSAPSLTPMISGQTDQGVLHTSYYRTRSLWIEIREVPFVNNSLPAYISNRRETADSYDDEKVTCIMFFVGSFSSSPTQKEKKLDIPWAWIFSSVSWKSQAPTSQLGDHPLNSLWTRSSSGCAPRLSMVPFTSRHEV